jgi:nucleoside-diphosphate-sugar epimerase
MNILLIVGNDEISFDLCKEICYILKNEVEKKVSIEVICINNFDKLVELDSVKYYRTNRKSINKINLKEYYDVVVDVSAILNEDISLTFENITFGKHILRSTFQVYNLVEENKVLYEEDISNLILEDNAMLNPLNNEFEKMLYSTEKLKCEKELIDKSIQVGSKYYILRASKIYSDSDQYLDINWIIDRLKRNIPFIFKKCDILKKSVANPVYYKDIAKVICNIVLGDIESNIFNIAQDEIISLIDIIDSVSNILNKDYRYHVIDEAFFTKKQYSNHRLPMLDNKIVSNNKIKNLLLFSPTKYTDWINELINSVAKKSISTKSSIENELGIIKNYETFIRRANNLRIEK